MLLIIQIFETIMHKYRWVLAINYAHSMMSNQSLDLLNGWSTPYLQYGVKINQMQWEAITKFASECSQVPSKYSTPLTTVHRHSRLQTTKEERRLNLRGHDSNECNKWQVITLGLHICLCDECISNHTINWVGDPHRGGTNISHSNKSFEVLSILEQEKDFTGICIAVSISWWKPRWKKAVMTSCRTDCIWGECAGIMLITLNIMPHEVYFLVITQPMWYFKFI